MRQRSSRGNRNKIPGDPGARPSLSDLPDVPRPDRFDGGLLRVATRPESARSIQTHTLLSAIRVIHQESRETYGNPPHLERTGQTGPSLGYHSPTSMKRERQLLNQVSTELGEC
ncbi:hypothetical protein NITLEN_50176 [Nitrospira lenta]|uniref:Uncharacterized protein n=1 Tax=Nitrospira lenta TaxID=1436998 RepID=A0A330LGB3_9BACT|nr:hypothetical protein NITLEN_50176 [Nitrospira lenta]